MTASSAHAAQADRNLLFGILALQMDFISRDALIGGMNAWVLDKAKSLGEILIAQQALHPEDGALLEAMVQRHLERHGHDPEKSLAAVGAAGLGRQELDQLGDAEVQASLSRILCHGPEQPAGERTIDYQPEKTSGSRFTILRPHAKGGLGEIFVALDEELNREVALKEIQARHAHEPVNRARFVQEAEITGRLEHPAIVPVYGFGQYADGRPYYAMRFIEGESLKQAVKRFYGCRTGDGAAPGPSSQPPYASVEFRKLLGDFVTICQAVSYAHSRDIIHRDIKPDNILLGKYGEALLVDWGLAKPLDRTDSAAETLERSAAEQPLKPLSGSGAVETVAGTALGTPGYMSPEQAAGRLEQVGPASDIYGLGATLYSLLTGRGPFAGADAGEVLQRVQKGEFPPPRGVQASVPRPLEAICLKAMAHEPAQRYRTAKELAEDIEHWLADEPVRAYREPVASRLGRWARRHRPLVAGAAVLLVSAVVALAVSTVLIGQQQRATLAHKEQAERNLALAKKAVDSFLNQVTENPRLKQTDLNDLRKELLESALPYYEEFVQQEGNDPDTEAERGRALYRLAKVRELLSEYDQALTTYQQMEQVFAPLVLSHPDASAYRRDLARSHHGKGWVLKRLLRFPEACQELREALALFEPLAGDFPSAPEYQQELARSHFCLGLALADSQRFAEAVPEGRKAIALQQRLAAAFPTIPDYRAELAESKTWVGHTLPALGRPVEAMREVREALPILERLAADFPRVSEYRAKQAYGHHVLGRLLDGEKRPKEAVNEFEKATVLFEGLNREFPSVRDYRFAEGNDFANLGIVQKKVGDLAAALKSLTLARAIFEQLSAAHQLDPYYRERFFFTQVGSAILLARQGDYFQAAVVVSQMQKQHGLKKDPALELEGGVGRVPYDIACIWSRVCESAARDQRLASDEKHRLVEDYAARALDWLGKACDAGRFQNPNLLGWLKKDPDLDALRSRPEFQKFVAGLEKATAKRP